MQKNVTFYEIAAHQSGITSANVDLPEELLGPLIKCADPSAISNLPFTSIDWSVVADRICGNSSTNVEGDRSTRSGQSTPAYSSPHRYDSPKKGVKPSNFSGEVMEVDSTTGKSNEALIDQLVVTAKFIRKLNYRVPTHVIDKSNVNTIAQHLTLLLSYLPGVLPTDKTMMFLLVANGDSVLEQILPQLPEQFNVITKSLLYGPLPHDPSYLALLKAIIQFDMRIVGKIVRRLVTSRFDVDAGCQLALEFLDDVTFLEFLQPQLAKRDSFISTMVMRTSAKGTLHKIIARLLGMCKEVLNETCDVPSKIASMPHTSLLLFCIVDVLFTNEPWKEEDIRTITKFVFRTSLQPAKDKVKTDGNNDVEMEEAHQPETTPPPDPDSPQGSSSGDSSPPDVKITSRPLLVAPPRRTDWHPSPFDDSYDIHVLAALIAIPYFSQFPTSQTPIANPPHAQIFQWLDAASSRTISQQNGVPVVEDTPFCEALLFIHSCVFTERWPIANKFLSETLRRKVDLAVRHSHVQILSTILQNRCMTVLEVVKRCAAQPVTMNLNENTSNPLALQSIVNLQSASLFMQHRVNIGNWFERQLDNIALPANGSLAVALEKYAQDSITHFDRSISKEFILKTFEGDLVDPKYFLKRLYLVLVISVVKLQQERQSIPDNRALYDLKFLSHIPFRCVISMMEVYHEECVAVRHRVAHSFNIIFSYLMPTPKSIEIVNQYKSKVDDTIVTEELLHKMKLDLRNVTSKSTHSLVRKVAASPITFQTRLIPFVVEFFSRSLGNAEVPEDVVQEAHQILDRCAQLMPRSVFEAAANEWLKNDPSANAEKVYRIPSLLFRCNPLVLESPPHFELLIDALKFFSSACKLNIDMRMAITRGFHDLSDKERQDNDTVALAFWDSQVTILVQALLEVVDLERSEKESVDYIREAKRQKIAVKAFAFIHRTFIDYDRVMKIVMFQAMPVRLVRTMVENVPSLFMAHAYIHELLAFPNLQRRIFGVVMVAELSRKYRVPETFEIAKRTCDVVHTLHKYGEFSADFGIWKFLIPALATISKEYPQLAEDVMLMLQRLAANVQNKMSIKYRMMPVTGNNEDRKLLNLIDTAMLQGTEAR